jgi:hypothetical protein
VKSQVFHVVLAICLVIGTWFASRPVLQTATAASRSQVPPVAPTIEADVMDLQTGDTFWGFHLTWVVPCAKMLVKGGGNLVTISLRNDGDARCIYHVLGEKRIELQGRVFRLRVTAPDQVHVEREPSSKAVVTNP